MTPDIVNGLYEFGGAFAIALSVHHLHRAKVVRGVSYHHVAFFTSWGLWNIFFYSSLDQWFSLIGGLALVAVNAVWLVQILHYRRKERIEQRERSNWRAIQQPIDTEHFRYDPQTQTLEVK